MAHKKILLATVAVPMIAWFGFTPATATIRPDPAMLALQRSDVVLAQANEEDAQQGKKKIIEEGRKHRNADGQDNGGDGQPRKKRQQAEDNNGGGDNADQPRKKRQQAEDNNGGGDNADQPRKKRQQAEDNNGGGDNADQPRKKKQQAEDNNGGGDNADQPRKKRQQAEDNNGGGDNADQPRKKRQQAEDNNGGGDNADQPRKKRQQAEDNSGGGDNADQPRKKKQQAEDNNGGGDNADQPRKKKQQAEDNNGGGDNADQPRKKRQQAEENNGGGDNADKPRKKKQQVEDNGVDTGYQPPMRHDGMPEDAIRPRLNVDNGAAVLDSDKHGDNSGRKKNRDKQKQADDRPRRVPKSDRDAQADLRDRGGKPIRIRPVTEERGREINDFRGYDLGEGRRLNDRDNRVIISIDGRTVVRDDDSDRLRRRDRARYEELDRGRIKEIVVRPDGSRVVTIRNKYGEIIRRSRVYPNDREVVLFYSPDLDSGESRLYLRDPGDELPPMRLSVPVEDYIIDVSREPQRNYEQFLSEPPVEPVERVYSVDEVKYSARLRDKVRRIDLDTITFDTGSADISLNQAGSLKRVGQAIRDLIDKDPGETFLIEGHTDAVGGDDDNLVLSDKRAESVANLLTEVYDIPAENLVTQGYGERYLKVNTDGPERLNRRVTIRRITPLVRPVASND